VKLLITHSFFSHAKGKQIQSGQIIPSLFKMDPPHQIIIDTVKLAEDDHGKGKQVILRLYEAYGGKSSAVLER
jgi:alpha-mannosidase